MAWSAPMTAALNSTFTAAQWNQYVRDNLLETEAAKATTRGRYFVTSGANSISEQSWYMNYNNGSTQSTTSTSYTDLSSRGPSVTNTTGTVAIVWWACQMGSSTSGAQAWCSVEVTGSSAVSASDTWAIMFDGMAAASSSDNTQAVAGFHRFTGLTAGSNTFSMKYRVSAGTGYFANRSIQVMSF